MNKAEILRLSQQDGLRRVLIMISKHYSDAHAVEMEGYGAAYAAYNERTPLIVIRGISDLRSGKTEKDDAIHQPVAAAHASAFAFELVALWGEYKPLDAPQMKSPRPTPSDPHSPPTSTTSEPKQNRQTLVLNFSGKACDFSSEKITEVVRALQEITNDPTLEFIRAEAGSFRMFVDAEKESLHKLRLPETIEKGSRQLLSDLARRLGGRRIPRSAGS